MSIYLTERKTEVCKYLVQGLKNEEIAQILNVSKHTVKSYISSMIYENKVKNRTQLAYLLGMVNFTGEINKIKSSQ